MTKEPIIEQFVESEKLPQSFADMAHQYYLPLASWLVEQRSLKADCLVLGINGSQGSGKSTLSKLLSKLLAARYELNASVISIDDFYLTRKERLALANDIHPLFETRGPPGTHDVELALTTISILKNLSSGEDCRCPQFDKANDNRKPQKEWASTSGPVDLIIFEGWMICANPQFNSELVNPINKLESEKDPDAIWRNYANDILSNYQKLWQQIDKLVFLQSPDFHTVVEWRKKQERKLSGGSFVMTDKQVEEFCMHYERLTSHCSQTLPQIADVVFTLNKEHAIDSARYR